MSSDAARAMYPNLAAKEVDAPKMKSEPMTTPGWAEPRDPRLRASQPSSHPR
jgi:hypothetical protein